MKNTLNALATLTMMIALGTQFTSIDENITILLLWVSIILINIGRISKE